VYSTTLYLSVYPKKDAAEARYAESSEELGRMVRRRRSELQVNSTLFRIVVFSVVLAGERFAVRTYLASCGAPVVRLSLTVSDIRVIWHQSLRQLYSPSV
jgi:hypothetical protein